MGYYSTVRGAITITPPLTWEEYQGSPFVDNTANREWRSFRLHMEFITDESAPEAPATGGPGIVATELRGFEDSHKCYYTEEHLAEFVTAFGANHTFSGYLIRLGEQQGDVERYVIDNEDGSVTTETARLVWSDGPIEDIEDVDPEDYEL
jgi:hypothetical protein